MNPTRRSFIGGVAALFAGFTALMVGPKQLENREAEVTVIDDDSWPPGATFSWKAGRNVHIAEPPCIVLTPRATEALRVADHPVGAAEVTVYIEGRVIRSLGSSELGRVGGLTFDELI